MTTPRQRQFLLGQAAWMVAGTALLASGGWLTVETGFVAAFVGLAVVLALTAPPNATVAWRRRLRWPLLVGAVLFLALVGVRTVEKFLGSI